MTPISKNIDYLQADNDVFYGNFLPTIRSIDSQYTEMLKKKLLTSNSLASQKEKFMIESLKNALNVRYLNELRLSEEDMNILHVRIAVLAAITHPKHHQVDWISPNADAKASDLCTVILKHEVLKKITDEGRYAEAEVKNKSSVSTPGSSNKPKSKKQPNQAQLSELQVFNVMKMTIIHDDYIEFCFKYFILIYIVYSFSGIRMSNEKKKYMAEGHRQ